MDSMEAAQPGWRRSSKCVGGECVEVRLTGDSADMRDAKDRDGGALRFDRAAWTAFIDDIRAGHLG
jgi:hypothetical protein